MVAPLEVHMKDTKNEIGSVKIRCSSCLTYILKK